MNLGVRFEYQTPFKERYNHLAYFDPSATEPVTGLKGVLLPTTSSHRYPSNPYKNWAPRVGLAWTFLPEHRVPRRIWPVLCAGQRRHRLEPGRFGQRIVGRHQHLLRANAGGAEYAGSRRVRWPIRL